MSDRRSEINNEEKLTPNLTDLGRQCWSLSLLVRADSCRCCFQLARSSAQCKNYKYTRNFNFQSFTNLMCRLQVRNQDRTASTEFSDANCSSAQYYG